MWRMNEAAGRSEWSRLPALLGRWLTLTVAVWLAAVIVPGVGYADWPSLLAAALVLGLLNSLVKPVLLVVSLPFVILTFGLFVLFINALLLLLAAKLVPGFHVAGFWSAMGAALIVSLVSLLFGVRRTPRASAGGFQGRAGRRMPPPGKGPIIDV